MTPPDAPEMEPTKRCTKCGADKPLREFGVLRERPDGRHSQCLLCRRSYMNTWLEATPGLKTAQSRAYNSAHPERKRASRRRWKVTHPEQQRSIWRNRRRRRPDRSANHQSRRRARKRGVEIESFSLAEIAERDGWICGICGAEVDPLLLWPDQMCASLDHIVPLAAKGPHTRGNCRLAHWICNIRRSDRLG